MWVQIPPALPIFYDKEVYMKKVLMIVTLVVGLVMASAYVTQDTTWKDSTGCYHTRVDTFHSTDTSWVKGDSVKVRCPGQRKSIIEYMIGKRLR